MSDEQVLPLVRYEGEDIPLAPRPSSRTATRTSAAFGGVEVGPPVSRMTSSESGRHLVDEPDLSPVAQLTATAIGMPDDVVAQTPPDEPVTAVLPRCAACGARLRPEEDWCSLCHAARRPEPLVSSAVPVGTVTAPVTAQQADPAADAPEGARVREDDDGQLALDFDTPRGVPEAEVERMLASLAGTDGPALRGLHSRQAKLFVAVGGGLGLTVLLLAGMAGLGAVLG